MPRLPIDYSKIVIYHFVCNDKLVIDTYVGHTTDMTKRKCRHKSACCNENGRDYNLKLYKNIRNNGGWENWEMKPLEEFSCENKIQARIREQYWIDKIQAKLNGNKAFVAETMKEYQIKYREEHRLDMREYMKVYDEERKEKRSEKITCKCGAICSNGNKSQHLLTKKHINSVPNV